jgi:hypothetical protein
MRRSPPYGRDDPEPSAQNQPAAEPNAQTRRRRAPRRVKRRRPGVHCPVRPKSAGPTHDTEAAATHRADRAMSPAVHSTPTRWRHQDSRSPQRTDRPRWHQEHELIPKQRPQHSMRPHPTQRTKAANYQPHAKKATHSSSRHANSRPTPRQDEQHQHTHQQGRQEHARIEPKTAPTRQAVRLAPEPRRQRPHRPKTPPRCRAPKQPTQKTTTAPTPSKTAPRHPMRTNHTRCWPQERTKRTRPKRASHPSKHTTPASTTRDPKKDCRTRRRAPSCQDRTRPKRHKSTSTKTTAPNPRRGRQERPNCQLPN